MLNEILTGSDRSTFAKLKIDLINHIQHADVAKNKPAADSAMIANLHQFA